MSPPCTERCRRPAGQTGARHYPLAMFGVSVFEILLILLPLAAVALIVAVLVTRRR